MSRHEDHAAHMQDIGLGRGHTGVDEGPSGVDEGPTGVIAVGFDGSSSSWHALWWAAATASARRLPLRIINVRVPGPSAADHPTIAGPRAVGDPIAGSMALIDAGIRSILSRGFVPEGFERVSVGGDPAEALHDAAVDAELLVVGSGGPLRARDPRVGSVSRGCMARAGVPVAVVPDRPQDPGGDVVVRVDASSPSLIGLRWALNEAALWHSRLVAVQGLDPGGEGRSVVVPPDDDLLRARGEALVRERLRAVAARTHGEPPAIELRPAGAGAPITLLGSLEPGSTLVLESSGDPASQRARGPDVETVVAHCMSHGTCAVVVVPGERPPSRLAEAGREGPATTGRLGGPPAWSS